MSQPVITVVAASRLLETVLGIRGLGQPSHPHLDAEWFRSALTWSQTRGRLAGAVCAAPDGVPAFLLPQTPERLDWGEELYHVLAHDNDEVWCELSRCFGRRMPRLVERQFADVRAGLAQLIRELDDYSRTVLEPLWIGISAALVAASSRPEFGVDLPDWYAPTVLGPRAETFELFGDRRLLVTPVPNATAALHRSGSQPTPLSDLLGSTRATILFALAADPGDGVSLRDLCRVTGQRRHKVLAHLDVLCRVNLVARVDGRTARPRFRRTSLSLQLLDA